MDFMYNFDVWGWKRGKCKNIYHYTLGLDDMTIETESILVVVSKNYNW
jgi:hypothetical protein